MPTPHLTPANLLGDSRLPARWQAAQTAFICFTPFPNGFKPYITEVASERYFLHSPNSEVRLGQFGDQSFLVLSEVYGFAVGSTTVEELIHYGIKQIIGVGYAGAFNGAPVGKHFVATATMSDLSLAHHYGVQAFASCGPTPSLLRELQALLEQGEQVWGEYTVWNGNSLYREYPETIAQVRDQGCDVVNMDTLSIYAVAPVCAPDARYLYVGTITDAADSNEETWASDLIEAVERQSAHPHDHLVKFMVESFLPSLGKPGSG